MCLAIPLKIKRIDGDFAWAGSGTVERKINIQMLSGVAIGDYVLVHAGFAIQIIDPQKARETLDLIKDIK